MIENKDKPKIKTVTRDVVLSSAWSLMSGRGSFEDYLNLRGMQAHCAKKLIENPELGFIDFICEANILIKDIIKKFNCIEIEQLESHWISPFMTLREITIIDKLSYLFLKQFSSKPLLDSDDDYIMEFEDYFDLRYPAVETF